MLLSIDVGIKNLAYCLFETPEKILDWNVINLCEKQQQQSLCTQTNCKFKAKFKAPKSSKLIDDSLDIFYCTRHAKKSNLIFPSRNTSKTVINAMRVSELREFAIKYIISSTSASASSPPSQSQPSMAKPALTEMINLFILNNSLIPCEQCESSKNISLIDIGISMKEKFDIIFSKHIQHISTIIIENQISPIAGRLKTLQGMIAQYFICIGKTDIRFVSASNKLKGYDVDVDIDDNNDNDDNDDNDTSNNIIEPKDGYNIRKMASVRITGELISSKFPEWTTVFKTHKKLDDLADAFLQGVWFNGKYVNCPIIMRKT